jgi:hypothetical protein
MNLAIGPMAASSNSVFGGVEVAIQFSIAKMVRLFGDLFLDERAVNLGKGALDQLSILQPYFYNLENRT